MVMAAVACGGRDEPKDGTMTVHGTVSSKLAVDNARAVAIGADGRIFWAYLDVERDFTLRLPTGQSYRIVIANQLAGGGQKTVGHVALATGGAKTLWIAASEEKTVDLGRLSPASAKSSGGLSTKTCGSSCSGSSAGDDDEDDDDRDDGADHDDDHECHEKGKSGDGKKSGGDDEDDDDDCDVCSDGDDVELQPSKPCGCEDKDGDAKAKPKSKDSDKPCKKKGEGGSGGAQGGGAQDGGAKAGGGKAGDACSVKSDCSAPCSCVASKCESDADAGSSPSPSPSSSTK
jgi:hypothetical protein